MTDPTQHPLYERRKKLVAKVLKDLVPQSGGESLPGSTLEEIAAKVTQDVMIDEEQGFPSLEIIKQHTRTYVANITRDGTEPHFKFPPEQQEELATKLYEFVLSYALESVTKRKN